MENEESGDEEDNEEEEDDYYLWDKEEELNTSFNDLMSFLAGKNNKVRSDAETGMFAYSLCMKIFDLLRKSPHCSAPEEAYKDVAKELLTNLNAKKMEKHASKKQKTASAIDYDSLLDL